MINAYELKYGDLVSWVHPATEKRYVFEVKSVDGWDEDQPVRLKMVSKLSSGDSIIVTENISFTNEDDGCWPYLNEAYLLESGYAPSGVDLSNVLTLDKLRYVGEANESDSNGNKGNTDGLTSKNKVRSVSDIKPGDVLHEPRHNAYFKVHAVQSQRALLEILNQTAQIQACPHEAIEEWFTAPGDVYWVYFDYENACDYFQTDRGINVWSTYLDEMFKVDPAELPSPAVPKIKSAVLTDRELKVTLDSGEEIAVKIPKLMLPKPEELRKIRERGVNELLDTVIVDIVEHNALGKNCLICGDLSYAELLTVKSKLEEAGYQVDLESGKISW